MNKENNEPQTAEVATVKQPVIVFKGKIVGDLEETIFTPELIAEKSKPLLALKINGVFDNAGAEAVKAGILQAVRMRTAVEKIEEPVIKGINAKAKKMVAEVREISKPIYDACYTTQNTLQATYDAWALEVKKAADKEADALKQRTDDRDNAMYTLGLTFNGQAFVGYGKVITKNSLHSLGQEAFDSLVTELEVLQLEQGVTGDVKPTPENNIGGAGSRFTIRPSNDFEGDDEVKYPTALYEKEYNGIRFVLTKGVIDNPEPTAVVINDRVAESAIYLQVIDYTK